MGEVALEEDVAVGTVRSIPPDRGNGRAPRTRVREVSEKYDRLAHRYEIRWRRYILASARETVSRLDLRPGIRLLDLACGTGALAREIGRRAAGVSTVGVDLSYRMLAIAQTNLPRSTPLLQGDARCLPLDSNCFDVVVSSSALHYWQRPREVLAEVRRVLIPGGQLVITDWCDDFLACRICDRVLRWISRSHQRIYGSDECVSLLRDCGYVVEAVAKYKLDWFWGLMTARAVYPPGERERRDAR